MVRSKTVTMRLKEIEHGKPMEELLRELYIEQGMTAEEIGERIGVTGMTVINWLRRLGIPTRTLMLPPEAAGRR